MPGIFYATYDYEFYPSVLERCPRLYRIQRNVAGHAVLGYWILQAIWVAAACMLFGVFAFATVDSRRQISWLGHCTYISVIVAGFGFQFADTHTMHWTIIFFMVGGLALYVILNLLFIGFDRSYLSFFEAPVFWFTLLIGSWTACMAHYLVVSTRKYSAAWRNVKES